MEILEFCSRKLQAEKPDGFEIFWSKSSSVSVEIKDGKLDHLSRATDQGLSIRVLKDQRVGFAYTFDLSRNAVEGAVRVALEIAELMPRDPLNGLPSYGESYPEIKNYDAAGVAAPLERKIELAKTVEAEARGLDRRITRVRSAGFDESYGESILMNGSGRLLRHESTFFGANLSCVAEDGEAAEMGDDAQYATRLDELSPQSIARYAVEGATQLLHGGAAPTMTSPVVFKNSVVAQLLGFLSGSFSAENVDKNFSLLVGKKGQKLFSSAITLVDDGILEGGIATAPFDGEGTPCRRTTLVGRGTIENFLYDSYYARKHRTASTGSSRRGGIKGPPSIGTSNLRLEKGTSSLDQLVASAKDGLYITDVMGLHTANPVTGEFSIGASGVLIEQGTLTRPVKGFAIAGNLLKLMNDVAAVGADARTFGSVSAPSALISRLSISGA